jgi:hypothetical protein
MRKAARTPRRVVASARAFSSSTWRPRARPAARRDHLVRAPCPVERGRIVLGGASGVGLVEAEHAAFSALHPDPRPAGAGSRGSPRAPGLVPLRARRRPARRASRRHVPRGSSAAFLGPGHARGWGPERCRRASSTPRCSGACCASCATASDPGVRPLGGDRSPRSGCPCTARTRRTGTALTTAQAFLALATHLERHGRGRVRALRARGLVSGGLAQRHPPRLTSSHRPHVIYQWRERARPESAGVLVVGGGIAGASVAYHLANSAGPTSCS